ncbi:MAG: F0F1 ATP synthase subunit alpha [Clostridiaceae bacterium]|nr:F0F1 ATP synthase subunit alpha [Clostridiaceae bacterium]
MIDPKKQLIRLVTAVKLVPDKEFLIASRFAEQHGIERFDVQADVDPELVGGMVVYVDGLRYDYSIRGQLDRIAGQMKKSKTQESFIDQLRQTLDHLDSGAAIDEIGTVIQVGDGVAYVSGIDNCRSSELLLFGQSSYGIAMNLETDRVGVVILREEEPIRQGMICKRTGMTVSVPVGKALLGRVVDSLGNPIDGLGPILADNRRPVESPAAGIVDRQPVNQPLHTGITAIDALTPIGRGQRELIIGDRQTGKTALAVDAILNQHDQGVYCIYVAVGQKMSTIANVVNILRAHGAMEYTTVVVAGAGSSASLQYLAPYAGCAMAEELMYNEKADVLIIYDDLTKHAQAYRALSLLMRRPPGREAFPGDVFYIHSRLLERAALLAPELGGGSMTALPIVETQSGDISAYIPTNVISITDGQIYLETELFFAGQRPAINVGLSVSRVGGAAQTKAMKKVAGPLRINLAQYRELESFAQFGSDLDAETRAQIKKGEHLSEILKQPQYTPLPVENQTVMLYLANKGALISLEKEDIRKFLDDLIRHIRTHRPEVLRAIAETGEFTDETAGILDRMTEDFLPIWLREHEDYGATR